LAVPGAPAQSTGDLRVLVILATWGPQPWTAEDVHGVVFEEANAFLRRSSFGQVSLHGDVTPWVAAYPDRPACPQPVHERVAPALSDPPTQAATRAGYAPSTYDRVIYVLPQIECPWLAVGVNREVLLNGVLSPWHVVHELGHTFGLAHAHGLRCNSAGGCVTDEYGDPFSPMGRGLVDFSAYEKLTMGWIREVARASKTGTYRVGRPDVLTAAPHALVVATGRGEYWLEQRLDVDPARLAVRVIEPDIPDDDLAPPTRFVPDLVRAGESFILSGAFSVRYVRMDDSRAELVFRWIDRTRPTRPALRAPARVRVGQAFRVSWTSKDTGSGLAFCGVRVDGRRRERIEGGLRATVAPLQPGRHMIAVSCTDRAGNESRAGVRRIQVVRR
jgi:gametolysin peptidase M11